MSEDQALQDARDRITDYRDRIQHLDENSIALLFSEARNHNWWQDKDVSDNQLREIWDDNEIRFDQLQHATGASDLHPFRGSQRG